MTTPPRHSGNLNRGPGIGMADPGTVSTPVNKTRAPRPKKGLIVSDSSARRTFTQQRDSRPEFRVILLIVIISPDAAVIFHVPQRPQCCTMARDTPRPKKSAAKQRWDALQTELTRGGRGPIASACCG